MFHGHRIAVVVPAYNEESWIAQVVLGVPSQVDWVVVVDDASTDRTAAVVRGLQRPGLVLVRHNVNRGVGAAIATGYRQAERLGSDMSIVMGGDGQMDPSDLSALMAPILFGRADYVKGNRFLHRDVWSVMPLQRIVGNMLLSWVTRYSSGYRGSFDSQCGYTAITTDAARRLGAFHRGYGYCNDVLARLHGVGAHVRDVSVRPIYNGAESGIRIKTAFYPIGWVLTKSWLRRLVREHWPRFAWPALLRWLFDREADEPSGPVVVWISLPANEMPRRDVMHPAFNRQTSIGVLVSSGR
ncbi:MAG: glycosyltransferase family 2 protein [Deltaproteobacteria bacterium]|nr:glycosyltransferase family 2 protein [Deltaproteobacteria bacterium]